MNININSAVSEDYLCTLAYVANAALAQYVELLEANLLGCVHIPLGGRKAFWRHIQCSVACYWFFRNQDTSGMDASHVWKVSDLKTRRKNCTGYLIPV